MLLEIMVAVLKVVSSCASHEKRLSISTLLGDAAEVKQKRYGIEKMGRVSDGTKRHGNSARLHASLADGPCRD
jgi:hypothetical protein